MDFLLLILEILLVNLVLSGDNAVVIALASRNLPPDNRKKAVWWGALAAVGLRIVLTVVAVYLLKLPFIQVAGALLLFWVAVSLLKDDGESKDIEGAQSLWKAVRTIVVADFIMSLDNVLAIASIANNQIWIMAIGVALSIPIIVWGSQLIMVVLHKFPIFIYLGAGILGYTAGEMLEENETLASFILKVAGWADDVFPFVCGLLVIAIGYVLQRRGRSRHVQEA
ncbi:TerC family protein [Paenibacillus sp. MWE-103]|uniref:TerC family protein n=1 Tax=Paenibacillus artemisiicola TaxID=1172618 RepID=A0ABS3WJ53_9BACL|nr:MULTISPECIES: TerC family protein [Paenibacillus]MBO7748121.1 TerC family protein [Paenibacillus artemisiicola]SFJ41672.1 integral membrane protein, YjbE family [Paenibacillus sp. UNC496MF]